MVPLNYVKILVSKIPTDIEKKKHEHSSMSRLKNFFWEFLGEWLPKIFGDKIAFAAQQPYTKIGFRCFVV